MVCLLGKGFYPYFTGISEKFENMTSPFISVITVVRNDLEGLKKTGQSIVDQTYKGVEWIIVDGASTDGTVEFLRNKPVMPGTWISELDNGIYDAMNKGVGLSKGKHAVFMNAGDVFDGRKTLASVKDALTEPGVDNLVMYGGAILEFPNGRKLYRSPKKICQYIWHGLPANHQATYYPVKWLIQNPYAEEYLMCGDYYIAACAHKAGLHSVYINMPLVKFRVGDTSYKHPIALICEAYLVQRRVLGLSFWSSFVSSLRRVAAIAATMAIYNLPKTSRRNGKLTN